MKFTVNKTIRFNISIELAPKSTRIVKDLFYVQLYFYIETIVAFDIKWKEFRKKVHAPCLLMVAISEFIRLAKLRFV